MKKNMPTTKLLLFFSWVFVALGFFFAMDALFLKKAMHETVVIAVLVIFGGLTVATILRAFANTSQLIFDLGLSLCGAKEKHHQELLKCHQELLKHHQEAEKHRQSIALEVPVFRSYAEQLSCDTKDINQSAHHLREGISDLKSIDQNIRQSNDLLLKIKNLLETK